jgi:hypothetical protein
MIIRPTSVPARTRCLLARGAGTFVRTKWGVSDPRRSGPRTGSGGGNGGRLRPTHLEAGQPLAEFLEDFPTVTREQAVATLEQAKEALLARARSA